MCAGHHGRDYTNLAAVEKPFAPGLRIFGSMMIASLAGTTARML
jgi:hypothetical protein